MKENQKKKKRKSRKKSGAIKIEGKKKYNEMLNKENVERWGIVN